MFYYIAPENCNRRWRLKNDTKFPATSLPRVRSNKILVTSVLQLTLFSFLISLILVFLSYILLFSFSLWHFIVFKDLVSPVPTLTRKSLCKFICLKKMFARSRKSDSIVHNKQNCAMFYCYCYTEGKTVVHVLYICLLFSVKFDLLWKRLLW